jgi:hypothetical protein
LAFAVSVVLVAEFVALLLVLFAVLSVVPVVLRAEGLFSPAAKASVLLLYQHLEYSRLLEELIFVPV